MLREGDGADPRCSSNGSSRLAGLRQPLTCDHGAVQPVTIVSFHAHPDDEALIAGGTLARAAAEGHRVVLLFATRGELGEVAHGFLTDGETLGQRREAEARRAGAVLGAARVEFLGYRDSGMAGEPTNTDPGAFATADHEEAAARVAALLQEESATVLTVYDERGGYGHPDHIAVHDVGRRAALQARVARVYAATMNRDHFRELAATGADELPEGVEMPDPDELELGVPEARITTFVDVRGQLAVKRAAMVEHASQIAPDSFFLAQTEEQFARAFGTEWFIRLDAGGTSATRERWIL